MQGLGALFPHHVGHYVGLDVHDSASVGRSVQLRSWHMRHRRAVRFSPHSFSDALGTGACTSPMTRAGRRTSRGMGVRVEDSVCVTEEGPLNLTVEAVKGGVFWHRCGRDSGLTVRCLGCRHRNVGRAEC